MVSLLNGFSEMGKSIAGFAGSAAVEQQKADLEQQQTILANQLREGSEIKLAGVQGDENRKTATTTAQEQGKAAIATATAENTLPMTAAQKDASDIQRGTLAETTRHNTFEEKKPVSLGLYGGAATFDTASQSWKPLTLAGDDLGPPDPKSPNLAKQVGLPENAIHAVLGDGLISPRNAIPYLNLANDWAAKNGYNLENIKAQGKGVSNALSAAETRNQLGTNQEREIAGSVKILTPLLEQMNAGTINKGNVIKLWGGGQVNDPTAEQVVTQLATLKSELAAFNAIANTNIVDGHPKPEKSDFDDAHVVISNGINGESLKAFGDTISASAQKNRDIIQQARNDANTRMFELFHGKYLGEGGPASDATPPPAADGATAPVVQPATAPAPTATPGKANPPPPPKKPDPNVQRQITSESIAATAKKNGITEDQVKKQLRDYGYTVP